MNCVEEVSHSKIKLEENQRKAIFLNPDNDDYLRIEIDDCLVKTGIRCDWAVQRKGLGTAFIELKGRDVSHAIEQLFATVKRDEVRQFVSDRIGFLVVCSQVPRFGSHVAKAKTIAARQYKAGFHVAKNQCELRLENVLGIRE